MWVLSCLRLLILISTSSAIESECINTANPPEVSVADSHHLLVNWAKSFEGCDSSVVESASVQTRSGVNKNVNFADNKAKIQANPCLKHLDIRMKVLVDGGRVQVWSYPADYNDYTVNPKPGELYSGLLRKPIHDKICDKSVNTFDVP